MNGVDAFMLVGVFQVWKWFFVLWFGGKEVLLKNEKKKKTRKQPRIFNDHWRQIELHRCLWWMLRTETVSDKIKILVTVVCPKMSTRSIFCRQQLKIFINFKSPTLLYSTLLIMKNPNDRWSKQLQIVGWSDSSIGSQFRQWPQLEKVATSLQLAQQGFTPNQFIYHLYGCVHANFHPNKCSILVNLIHGDLS